MKTEWDYTSLADAYVKRPEYCDGLIDLMVSAVDDKTSQLSVCDVGAGVGHLTIPLLERGIKVDAVEPNDAMRSNGRERTSSYENVTWFEGTGEMTGRPSESFDLVSFGSSFNVCDREMALSEAWRLLKPRGIFCCMWNHRDLTDPHQHAIESIIKHNVRGYSYGSRREDQTAVIKQASARFSSPIRISGDVLHEQTVDDCIEAWRSHATLERQAGGKFVKVIEEISSYLYSIDKATITIPYTTNAWLCRKIDYGV